MNFRMVNYFLVFGFLSFLILADRYDLVKQDNMFWAGLVVVVGLICNLVYWVFDGMLTRWKKN